MGFQITFILTHFLGNFIYNDEAPDGSEKKYMGGYKERHLSPGKVPHTNKFHIPVLTRKLNGALRSPFRDALRSVY